jgi:hypothetical protein
MSPEVMIGSLAALVAALTITYFALFQHSTWKLHARFARNWDEHARYHAESLARFAELTCLDLPPELERVVALLRKHDMQNLVKCTLTAKQWRERIPSRLRDHYMRQAA